MRTPEVRNAEVQNAIGLAQALGKLDADVLTKLVDGVAGGAGRRSYTPRAMRGRPLGVFELLALLKDPNVSASIRFLLRFLSGMGKVLREDGTTSA